MIDYVVRPISDRTAFTGRHRPTPFASSWSATEDLLDRELRQLKARDVALELDFLEGQIRLDGRPKATARATSPATRLAFESMHGPLTYATDVFPTWQDNVRAIALGLEALRRVDRYGVVRRGEQYAGFKQLGAGRAMPASHMTSSAAAELLRGYARGVESLATCYKAARVATHPDRNDGDHSRWDRVEEAAKVLGLIA